MFSSLMPRSSVSARRCDVFEHGLAAIAEARRLHGRDAQRPAEFVDHQRGERFTLDVLGDDEQRTARLRHLLEHRQQVLHVRELLLVNEHERVLEHGFHSLRVGDEVGRQVSAIELHALDHVEGRLERLRLLDGDDAVLADLLHRFRDDLADRLVAVRGDGAHLRDHVSGDRRGQFLDLLGHHRDGLVDPALERHRVGPGGDVLRPLADDRLRQHCRGGRPVTSDIGGLACDLLDHPCAEVLDGVGEVDLLRDGHAVLGDDRGTELLVEHDVPALRTERHLHRIGELVHAAEQRAPRVFTVMNLLCHGLSL
jgi:hypothetical protein